MLERRVALCRGARRCAFHGIGRLLHLLRGTAQLLRPLLPSQPLELPCLLLRLLRQVALRPTAATTTALLATELLAHRFRQFLHAFVLLLLPRRKLLQALQRGVHFARSLLLRFLLHGLVLIVQLVGLQFEKVRQLLRLLCTPATSAPAAAPTHLHLHVAVQLFRTLKPRQRLLFDGERFLALRLDELLLRGLKSLDSLLELTLDQRKRRVRARRTSLGDASGQSGDFLAEPSFRDIECRDVFAVHAR